MFHKVSRKLVPSLTAQDPFWPLIPLHTEVHIVILQSLFLATCTADLGQLLGHSQTPWLQVVLLEALPLVSLYTLPALISLIWPV